jgi:hypothetical protein
MGPGSGMLPEGRSHRDRLALGHDDRFRLREGYMPLVSGCNPRVPGRPTCKDGHNFHLKWQPTFHHRPPQLGIYLVMPKRLSVIFDGLGCALPSYFLLARRT